MMKSAQSIPVNVVGSSTFGRYNKISSEKTYNMFISDNWLLSFAGYERIQDIEESGEGRGIFRSIRADLAVVVINNGVYRLDANISPTFIGVIETSTGKVSMDENLANQICIVDGTNAYIYNHALGSLTKQDIVVDLVPNYVCYHNTFFLLGNGTRTGNGAKWFAFSYETDTTISSTTELALETKPDYAVAVKRIPGQSSNVLVFGTAVCEVQTQVGGLENYQRNSSVNVDYGCLSVDTIAASDQYVVWLAINESNSPVIMTFSREGANKISSDGIDYVLNSLTAPDQSVAFFYRQDGHLFYQITFYNKNDNLTLAYDFNTKKFFHLSDHNLDYHPALEAIYFNDAIYFVSLNNASVYRSNTTLTTYNENQPGSYDSEFDYEIPRVRICNNVRKPDSSPFRVKSFVMTIDQGNDPDFVGLNLMQQLPDFIVTQDGDIIVTQQGDPIVTQGSQLSLIYKPRVDLAMSKDGGQTFSSYSSRVLNTEGKRKNILSWQSMGINNDLVFKLRFWGTSYFLVNNGLVDIF